MSRVRIAEEMSRILGREIKKGALDDFIRSRKKKGRPFRFPAAWVPALCRVIKNDELQRHLLDERLREFLSIGESIADSPVPLKRAYEAVARLTGEKQPRPRRTKR
jgi:hypothetical protein